MARRWIPTLLAILALAPVPAGAQDDEPATRLEVGAHGGLIFLDGGGTNPLAGGRATVRLSNGLGIGANAHWTRRSLDPPDGDTEEATAWLYDVEGSWVVPSESRANFIASLGIGVARFDPTDSEEAAGADTESEISIPLGLGYRWYNYDGEHRWAARLDVRDYVILVDGEGATDDAVTNNYQVSFGFEIFLGSTP